MKDTVIVFARVPRLGAVKRRLARDVGDRAALRFHTETLHRLLMGLRRQRRFRTVLALFGFILDRLGNPFAAVSLRRNLVVGAGILWVAMVGGLLWMALNELPLVAL